MTLTTPYQLQCYVFGCSFITPAMMLWLWLHWYAAGGVVLILVIMMVTILYHWEWYYDCFALLWLLLCCYDSNVFTPILYICIQYIIIYSSGFDVMTLAGMLWHWLGYYHPDCDVMTNASTPDVIFWLHLSSQTILCFLALLQKQNCQAQLNIFLMTHCFSNADLGVGHL